MDDTPTDALGDYPLSHCFISSMQTEAGALVLYDFFAELSIALPLAKERDETAKDESSTGALRQRRVELSTPLFIAYEELLYMKVVKAKSMLHLALPSESVWEWAVENHCDHLLSDMSATTSLEACKYPIAVELEEGCMAHFLQHVAPLIAQERRTARSHSRISVSMFIPVPAELMEMASGGDEEAEVNRERSLPLSASFSSPRSHSRREEEEESTTLQKAPALPLASAAVAEDDSEDERDRITTACSLKERNRDEELTPRSAVVETRSITGCLEALAQTPEQQLLSRHRKPTTPPPFSPASIQPSVGTAATPVKRTRKRMRSTVHVALEEQEKERKREQQVCQGARPAAPSAAFPATTEATPPSSPLLTAVSPSHSHLPSNEECLERDNGVDVKVAAAPLSAVLTKNQQNHQTTSHIPAPDVMTPPKPAAAVPPPSATFSTHHTSRWPAAAVMAAAPAEAEKPSTFHAPLRYNFADVMTSPTKAAFIPEPPAPPPPPPAAANKKRRTQRATQRKGGATAASLIQPAFTPAPAPSRSRRSPHPRTNTPAGPLPPSATVTLPPPSIPVTQTVPSRSPALQQQLPLGLPTTPPHCEEAAEDASPMETSAAHLNTTPELKEKLQGGTSRGGRGDASAAPAMSLVALQTPEKGSVRTARQRRLLVVLQRVSLHMAALRETQDEIRELCALLLPM